MRRSEQTGQMRIAQRVECSGEEHTVTLDARGCLHTTCHGLGCTKALERARFLLTRDGLGLLYANWPMAWHGALDRVANKRRARAAAKRSEPLSGVRERLSRRAVEELNEALKCVGYHAGKADKVVRKHTAQVGLEHAPAVQASTKFSGAFSDVARTRQSQSTLSATTSAVAWLRLTRHMPGGRFLERTAQRVAVAILDPHPQVAGARPGDLVVAAGKPGAGMTVTTAPALVRKRRNSTWARVRWLQWQELPDEAVECYGRFGLCHRETRTTALAATYGRKQWASAREEFVHAHRSDLATARGNVAMLRAKLQGFVHTIDELRMLRDQADVAIVSYSTTDMGEVAGCTSTCTECVQHEGCPAHAERARRHEAVIDYERTRKQLALAEHNVEGIRRRAIEAGCAPEELEADYERS